MKIKLTPKKIWQLLKESYKEFSEDDTWVMGAALSYYTVFSLAPVLFIVIFVAGMIFGEEAVRGEVYDQIRGFVGDDAAVQVQQMVASTYDPDKSWWATALAIGLLIFGATTVFYQLQASINKIWEVKPKPKKGFIKYIRDRILSFSVIIAIGFLLLVSLVISALLVAFTNFLSDNLPGISVYLIRGFDIIFSFAVYTALFAMIYKLLPDAKVRWRDVWVGSGFTALLFMIGKYIISIYLGSSDIGSTYGAAGSIIILLSWVSYSSQILFFGAEFTQVYARHYGSVIQPNEYAVRVKSVEVEQNDKEGARSFENKIKEVQEFCALDEEEAKEKSLIKKKDAEGDKNRESEAETSGNK